MTCPYVRGDTTQFCTLGDERYAVIDALRPPCPTCGGMKSVAGGRESGCVEAWPECASGEYDPRCCRFPKSCSCTRWIPCPENNGDCDGKVSWERLVRQWTAFMELPINEWDQFHNPVAAAIVHIRTVVR